MFSVVLNFFLSLDIEIWLPVFVLLRLRVPFVLERLSAIKVQLELELEFPSQGWSSAVKVHLQLEWSVLIATSFMSQTSREYKL